MTQEEIIKLAHAAGFNWPDIQATTIEQRLERFASLVAATEREKFTNTQEFVTLPREVVEQALKVLEYAANDVLTGRNAATELRAALEQPHTTEQSYMGCVTSDMHELAEWLHTMHEDAKEQIAALEQPQVGQEPVARVVGTGHLGGHFDWCKPGLESPDLPSGTPLYTHPQPKREPLSTARIDELIEDGIFGGNPYELVRRLEEERGVFMTRPLTDEQIDRIIADLAPEFLDTPTGFEEDFCRAIEAAHGISQAAAPQQVEQEPAAWLHSEGKTQPLYLHTQPQRQPLTLEQIAVACGWKNGCLPLSKELEIARAIEAAHNIK